MNASRALISQMSISVGICICVVCFSGCGKPVADSKPKRTSIFNKKTQDIAEADPNAEQADLSVKTNLPGLVGLGAYGSMVSDISKMQIKQSLELYRATNGEYPEDFETFKTEIIDKNKIELPVLPGGRQYQYDVDNHELIVVEKEDAKPSGK